MQTLIALLRALNVGGTGKMPMSDLRKLAEDAGFQHVRTYIQSGNLVFQTSLKASAAKAELEKRLLAYAGKPVGVVIRDAQEMQGALQSNPFADAAPNKVVAIFLDAKPEADADRSAKGRADEEIALGRREIYIHYPFGIGSSKLRLSSADHGTARNMNTVARLAKMAMETP